MSLRYCVQCILPDTRPNLKLDGDGVCNACRSSGQKRSIDWAQRELQFREVAAHAKAQSKSYDCLVPVSGGKDSTWQIIRCLEYGLHPLAVTWKSPGRTPVGQRNLNNLVNLGVDHIDYQVNPEVERQFMRKTLDRLGSTAIPMHLALFNIPLTIAARFDIPLVVWGENSAFEYGGDADASKGFRLDTEWLRRYGVTQGTTAEDWIDEDLTREELTPYFGPGDATLESRGLLAVFLGYYFEWDPETSLKAAQAKGFETRAEGPKTGIYDYADIDDDFISIHHFLKWYKFGFTRSYDNLSLEIRNGRMSRNEAIDWLRRRGDETPWDDIRSLCRFLRISQTEFFEMIEKFRNQDIWHRRNDVWQIDDFLIEDWPWRQYANQEDRSAAAV